MQSMILSWALCIVLSSTFVIRKIQLYYIGDCWYDAQLVIRRRYDV